MRVIVIGLGVQGHKRRRVAGADYVCSVDPVNPDADFRKVEGASLKRKTSAVSSLRKPAPTPGP